MQIRGIVHLYFLLAHTVDLGHLLPLLLGAGLDWGNRSQAKGVR